MEDNKKIVKASLKFDLIFEKKLNKVCDTYGLDKSKIFRTLVELEDERIRKFKGLINKKIKK